MPVKINCQHCQKEMNIKPSRLGRSKYCSKYCHSKMTVAIEKRSYKKCARCEKEIIDKPSKIHLRKFCSVSCQVKYHWEIKPKERPRESHNRYKNGSGIYREEALKCHGEKCQKCGASDNIEIHHKDKNRKNNNMENLQVLCRDCHHREHAIFKIPNCLVCLRPVNRHKNKYCSRECMYHSMRTKI